MKGWYYEVYFSEANLLKETKKNCLHAYGYHLNRANGTATVLFFICTLIRIFVRPKSC